MSEVRIVDGVEYVFYGAKGDKCVQCNQVDSQFIIAVTDTDFMYVCQFCDVALATKE